MSEHDELVKRLHIAAQAIKIGTGNHWAPPHYLSVKATSGPEAQEFLEALAHFKEEPGAAQAIERLERERDEKELARKVTSEALGDTARERDKETDLAEKAERELEIVTASLTDQETENGRLREQLAEARAQLKVARAFHQEVLGTLADMGICTPAEGYLKPSSPRVSRDLTQIQRDALEGEALAPTAPGLHGQGAGMGHMEYDSGLRGDGSRTMGYKPTPAPSTGEAERLKALGNAEQIAANRAANTTDPREAAVASRIANDIKQLRE